MTDDNIQRSLGRIEGKLDSIDRRLRDGETRLGEYSQRIRKLEGWQRFVLGMSAVVAVVVNFVLDFWER